MRLRTEDEAETESRQKKNRTSQIERVNGSRLNQGDGVERLRPPFSFVPLKMFPNILIESAGESPERANAVAGRFRNLWL